MKQKLKIEGTLVLGAVFAAAVLCCSFCQPFRPGAVCAAIPAQATFVHKAVNLDELWNSPVCSQLDSVLGAGNSIKDLLGTSRWIKLTVPAEIAVAAIPLHYTGQTKAWVAVSWVGWRSPWLRWRLEHTRAEGFHFLGKHAAWPVWKYDTPDIARGTSLTFALTDNLFITCLSEHPSDIRLILDTYDKRIPSYNDLK